MIYNYEYYYKKLQSLTLLDDTFMRVVFKNVECTQYLIRTILNKKDLKITKLQVQDTKDNVLTKSIILDVFAIDDNGDIYNIEVQRENKGASPRRARYNSSMIDTHILEKGSDVNTLPNTYVIFITENDVLGKDFKLYTIKRTIQENGELFDDGATILYLNTSKVDDSELGRLSHDLKCNNSKDMYSSILRDEVKKYKEDETEVRHMCRVMEEIKYDGYMEGVEKGIEEGIERGIERGIEKGIEKGIERGKQELLELLRKNPYLLKEYGIIENDVNI